MSNAWPEVVPVARSVGEGSYKTCAAGRFCQLIGSTPSQPFHKDARFLAFSEAYKKCMATYSNNDYYTTRSVEHSNDNLKTDSERAFIYNAAIAMLGYIDGQDLGALLLATEAAKKYGKVKTK